MRATMESASAPKMKPGQGPSVSSFSISDAGDLTLSGRRPTSQDSRGPEKSILLHDGEHALEFFGRCLRTARALIPCKFDKTMLNEDA